MTNVLAKTNDPNIEMRRQIAAAALRDPSIINDRVIAALGDGTARGRNLQAIVAARRDITQGKTGSRLDWKLLAMHAAQRGFRGDISHIQELLDLYPPSRDGEVQDFLNAIEAAASHRQVKEAFREALQSVSSGVSPEEAMLVLARRVKDIGFHVEPGGISSKDLRKLQVPRDMLMPQVLLPAPWPRLNVFPGTLTTLVGPSGGGKTAMMSTIAEQLISSGRNVVYFMTELNTPQMIARALCRHDDTLSFEDAMLALSITEPKNEREHRLHEIVSRHEQMMRRMPGTLHYHEASGYDAQTVVNMASAYRNADGYPDIIVDYADMLDVDTRSGNLPRGFAMALAELKTYAQRHGTLVIVAQQTTVSDVRSGAPAWGSGQNSGAFLQRSNLMLTMTFPIADKDEHVSGINNKGGIRVSKGSLHPYGTMIVTKNTWGVAGVSTPIYRGKFHVVPVSWEVVNLNE